MKKTIICIAATLLGCSLVELKADIKITNFCKVSMSSGVILDVKGNWENNSPDFMQTNGKIVFSGSDATNTTIQHTGSFQDVTLNKTGNGVLSLNSNLNIKGLLTMTNGKIQTNSFMVDLGTTGSVVGEANGKLIVGKLSANRIVGTGTSNFGEMGLSIASGTDNIGTITAVRTTGTDGEVNINGTKGILRKWQLTGTAPTVARNITFNWLSDEDNANNLNSMKIWNSANSTTWYGIAENLTGTTHTITRPVTSLGSFTISSESPINLPSTIGFNEDNPKIINLTTGLKGTGKFNGFLDDCTIYFSDGKSINEIQKGKSERAYSLSVTGNTNIGVSFNAMNATLTPLANWNGTENIKFTLTETSKKSSDVTRSSLLGIEKKSITSSKALESFYDIAAVTVSAVNDAPAIVSFFPNNSDFSTTLKNVKFSVKASDVDNLFSALSFKWFVKKNSEAEVQQSVTDSVFTSNFTSSATYTVRGQVSDGLLQTSKSWTVIANPSTIGNDLLPTITEIQQNYPNPFNPTTTINYSIKDAVPVSINVYNYSGQLVKTLVNGTQKPGYYSVNWNAADMASGLYFYQMKAGDYLMIKRAVVIK